MSEETTMPEVEAPEAIEPAEPIEAPEAAGVDEPPTPPTETTSPAGGEEPAESVGTHHKVNYEMTVVVSPPDPMVVYDRESLSLINGAERDAYDAEQSYLNAKEVASERKKTWEVAQLALSKVIRDRRDNRGKPREKTLLDHIQPPTPVPEGEDDGGTVYAEPETLISSVPEDLWEKFPIERLKDYGLKDGDVAKLHAGELKDGGTHPIITFGDLKRFISPYPDNPSYTRNYSDIKGIGKAGVDRISDAHDEFWKQWGRGLDVKFAKEMGVYVRPPEEDETAPEEPADATAEGDGGSDPGEPCHEGNDGESGSGGDVACEAQGEPADQPAE